MTLGAIAIVGPGRMGLALGQALQRSGAADGITFFGRHPEPPSHPLFVSDDARYVFGMEPLRADCRAVFLAVPDDGVPDAAQLVASQGPAPDGCGAFHLSGALPTDVLGPLHAAGYAVGAFRPLVLVSRSFRDAERIPGAAIALTAGPAATRIARDIASAIDCHVLSVPAHGRPLFDAAITLTTSYLPLLLDSAARVLERAGTEPEQVLEALVPLVRSVLAEIEAEGLPAALEDGPLGGGDLEAVALHLRALDEDDRKLYAMIGRSAASLAGAHLAPGVREELLERFDHEIGARP